MSSQVAQMWSRRWSKAGAASGVSFSSCFDANPKFFIEPDPGPDRDWRTPDDVIGDIATLPGSWAIDAGDTNVVTMDPEFNQFDVFGNARIVDTVNYVGSGVGTGAEPDLKVDIGAWEAPAVIAYACDGDANGDGAVDVNDISYVLFRLGDPCPV